MKNIKSIVGLWNGFYNYDSEEFSGVSIRFSMSLNLKKGEITGKCYDSVDDGGFAEAARIRGFIEDNKISLIKQYPHLIYIDEAGEYIRDKSQKHPEIHYLGEIADGMVKGTWETNLHSINRGDEVAVDQITGKWEMKKENWLFFA